jgi:epoxide hydrolase-like predicted phosphatase
MLVTPEGRFLSQRDLVQMALLRPSYDGEVLTVDAPGASPLVHKAVDDGDVRDVTVHRKECQGVDQGDEAAAWFSGLLDADCRLVRFTGRRATSRGEGEVMYADGYPLLVISAESLDDLNTRLDDPLPMNRFRPSLVIEGLGPYGEDTDHVWHQVERGEVPITDWIAWIGQETAAAGITIDWEAFGSMMGRLTVHDVIVDRIRSLRDEGYRTALCTNNVKEGSTAWRERVPVDELFDAVVDSSEVGMRKPDPRIYTHTLAELGGVAPERSVFLDDYPGNITAAEAVGMIGVLVDADATAAITRVDDLLAAS